jgi:isopropylmalate/homocitrate/citramalate synthase
VSGIRQLLVEDTTLREGEQTPGVALNYAQKHAIVEALADAGIRYVEVGTPAMGSSEGRNLRKLREDFPELTLIGWNRGVKADLEETIQAGFKALHVGLPSSDVHIKDKFGKDKGWVLDTAAQLVSFARAQGVTFISISAEDMGRADPAFLRSYVKLMAECGVSRMRLSDTVGCLTPTRVASIVRELRSVAPLDFQLHMHNDFNLAMANVLAGVEAGATQVHVTINGLGERAGLAALHQVATGLKYLMPNVHTGIDLTKLPKLSAMVAEFTGLPVAHNEPVVGEHAFTHESGIHVEGVLKVAKSFEAFPPEAVGRKHEFKLGKHSGSTGIQHMLASAGYEISRDEAKTLLPLVRDIAPLIGGDIPVELIKVIAEYSRRNERPQH